ncbi:MAG: 50S ribosomal protein L3 [Bacteroidetes bacterium]|nr:MAG: 50S ribosomal protein L3 [Bacteroidota bacterium]
MSNGIIGIKLGMTAVFSEDGRQFSCTAVRVDPNIVTQVKTVETDGYASVQLGVGERKVKHTTKAMMGHFEAAGTTPKKVLREFTVAEDAEISVGDEINITDLFEEGQKIDVSGISIGKGFQGVVKRHGFAGVGDATHGQHNRQRAPGSIGASSWPSRVFKGMRMGGRMGGDRVTVKNLTVVRILEDQNLILVEGAVPGPTNGTVELRKKK